ncbi:uncharacterized protein B0T15DRAFT_179653 [Chaetomium strumarium]|uniref:Uncharacterized protein n=1 Tax=Chaetomium strumarium TaxID=1170767 RepID=A0AAJ0M3K7_9PEZI|nr:hypothetical protein B0T15DRAFT_179653 [Chaetomium strumarium]
MVAASQAGRAFYYVSRRDRIVGWRSAHIRTTKNQDRDITLVDGIRRCKLNVGFPRLLSGSGDCVWQRSSGPCQARRRCCELGGESCRRFRGGPSGFRHNIRLISRLRTHTSNFDFVEIGLAEELLPNILHCRQKAARCSCRPLQPPPILQYLLSKAVLRLWQLRPEGISGYRFGNTTAAFPSSCGPRHLVSRIGTVAPGDTRPSQVICHAPLAVTEL